jgi:hypothetical protein
MATVFPSVRCNTCGPFTLAIRHCWTFNTRRVLDRKVQHAVRVESAEGCPEAKSHALRDLPVSATEADWQPGRLHALPESHRLVESRVEEALISRLQDFLLELGSGFAIDEPPRQPAIAGRLSLRHEPQRRSLEILDRITEIAPPGKGADVAAMLEAIRSEFPR